MISPSGRAAALDRAACRSHVAGITRRCRAHLLVWQAGVQARAEQIHRDLNLKQLQDATQALLATPALSSDAEMRGMLDELAENVARIKGRFSK